jgi:hypothetical protein
MRQENIGDYGKDNSFNANLPIKDYFTPNIGL